MKKIEQKVLKFIDEKNLIRRGDKILIALSGGPDSVFLLHFLHKFKKRFDIELGAFHLNHSLRGDDSELDERFCREICHRFKIEYFSAKRDIRSFATKNKFSIEEAGRNVRYTLLESIAQKYNYSKIATGHNKSDNAETVFLNLIKGAGLKGLSGIPVIREKIIRPILVLTKDEILEYLKHHNVAYRMDASNIASDYERNFIRLELFPKLKAKLNPALEDVLFHTSDIFKKYNMFIQKKVQHAARAVTTFSEGIVFVCISELNKFESELTGDILREAVSSYFEVELSFKDVEKLILILKKPNGTSFELTNGLTAVKERKDVHIFKQPGSKKFGSRRVKPGDKIKLQGKILTVKKADINKIIFTGNQNREYISADKIVGNFVLRRWENGDKFYPLGLKGVKKISDFLNDVKIHSYKRDDQLVLTNADKIVWVLGLRIDDRFKITNHTKKVLELCLN